MKQMDKGRLEMNEKKTSLAELRLERGLSQRELAKQIHVSSGTIGMYEVGKRTPSLEKAKRIAAFFGIPLENIIFESVDNGLNDLKIAGCEIGKGSGMNRKKKFAEHCNGQISLFEEF